MANIFLFAWFAVTTFVWVITLIEERDAIIDFFLESIPKWVKELSQAKFKVVNNNEGLYPISLYQRRFFIWCLVDTYKQFEHARDDIFAFLARDRRGFRTTSTYYNKDGRNVHDSQS